LFAFCSIRRAAERRHFDLETVEWIIRMLECRILRSRFARSNKDHKKLPPRGCFIASSVFFVIGKLLTELEPQGNKVFGFVEEIVSMVKDKVDSVPYFI
jgi:hypothetical protein